MDHNFTLIASVSFFHRTNARSINIIRPPIMNNITVIESFRFSVLAKAISPWFTSRSRWYTANQLMSEPKHYVPVVRT